MLRKVNSKLTMERLHLAPVGAGFHLDHQGHPQVHRAFHDAAYHLTHGLDFGARYLEEQLVVHLQEHRDPQACARAARRRCGSWRS